METPPNWFVCPLRVAQYGDPPREAGELDHIPRRPGVYAIYRYGKLVYIGSSSNLRARLGSHEKLKKGDAVKIKLTRKLGDWLMIEYRLIARLQPELNTTVRHQRAPRA